MGRKRKKLNAGDSTYLYIPQDIGEEELNWINEQKHLNKAILNLIRTEISQNQENMNLESVLDKLIEEKMKNYQLKEIESFKNDTSTNEEKTSIKKKVLTNLTL